MRCAMDFRLASTFSVVIVLLAASVGGQRNHIVFNNNEYGGLLVAIHDSIPEDPYLIERIKTVFTDASRYLYNATEARAHFKNVTILIPRTWNESLADEAATTEKFCIANVVVDQPNPEYGDNPYVKQTKPCGKPGEYMHLTSRWLTDIAFAEYYWGDSGKVVVHEWGHLRWGLFDEYATEDVEHFYYDESGRVQPTRCSAAIAGVSRDIDNNFRSCNRNPDSGVYPSPGCRFFPNLNSNDGRSSYLFGNYLDSVSEFCHSDPSKPASSRHNRLARNKQNKNCCYSSAWEVMLGTPDFFNGSNTAREVEDTAPSFRVVQERDLRIVLVLDVSGSMNNANNPTRFELMIQSCAKYIQYTVPNNTYIGIVEFSTTAGTLSGMVYIDSAQARQQLVDKLPARASGATCIGCGLREGVKVLEGGPGATAAGGILFLLSDGEENRIPDIDDVTPELISKKVIVDSLAFSADADDKLTHLSQVTNGLAFYYSESSQSTALNDAFASTIAGRTCSGNTASVQLISIKPTLTAGDMFSGNIVIDSSIGSETIFFFFWQSQEVDVKLTSPDGTVYNDTSPAYQADPSTRSIIIQIPGRAQVGRWTYNVTNPSANDQTVEIAVESKPADGSTSPIRLSSTLSSDLISESPPVVIIYAYLSQGYVPVTGASVFATVDRPHPHLPTEVQLFDNGVGADVSKDDGVYSGYFLDFEEADCGDRECRYSVQVTADDKDGNALIRIIGKMGALPKNFSVIPETGDPTPVGDFARISAGGVIQVSDDVKYREPGEDLFPPSAITDLEAVAASYENQTIELQWTATGDDFDKGTAAYYDLRYSTSFSHILDNFDNATVITDQDVVIGNLSNPEQSETLETFVVRMPVRGTGTTYYFAVKAVDDGGNVGAISNIAQQTLVPPLVPSLVPPLVVEDEGGLKYWHIIIIVTGSILLVAVIVFIIAAVYSYRSQVKRKNKYHNKPYEGKDNPLKVQA
ncbi:calcium-activated chloride channel regulator 4-like [Ptychodera flava]|uniref:calcium-activated chloride channel regulator 4-like n=1 Tax=Ptychodera flava TaxID=63121 RepID=UPI00396A4A12